MILKLFFLYVFGGFKTFSDDGGKDSKKSDLNKSGKEHEKESISKQLHKQKKKNRK